VGLGAAALLGACAAQIRSAQLPKLKRIGYLAGGSTQTSESEAFRQELGDLGVHEGRDIVVELRHADSVPDRLPGMASELIGLPADVLVTAGSLATLAATRETSTIPIVFHRVTDPVGQQIVASLARPGGNVTGVSASPSLGPKQLELLRATIPQVSRVAVLWNANNPGAALQLRDTQDAARTLRLELEVFGVHNPDELDAALDAIARSRPDALVVGPAFNLFRNVAQIPDFASKIGLPQTYGTDAAFVRAGGLMAIGANTPSMARRAAHLVKKVLQGGRPADLPVELPTQIDFIVNLTAAQRIGLVIPESVLRQATELV
jgi:putative ABC transport system substrate-binding protein